MAQGWRLTVSDDERSAIEAAAQRSGFTPSAWLRRVAVAVATGRWDPATGAARIVPEMCSDVHSECSHVHSPPGVPEAPTVHPSARVVHEDAQVVHEPARVVHEDARKVPGKVAKLFPPVKPTGPRLNGEPGTIDISARQTDLVTQHERWTPGWWSDVMDTMTRDEMRWVALDDTRGILMVEDRGGVPPLTDDQRKQAVAAAKARMIATMRK